MHINSKELKKITTGTGKQHYSPLIYIIVINMLYTDRVEFVHIHYSALHSKALPRCYEIINFGRAFLGHYFYLLKLSDLCPSVD